MQSAMAIVITYEHGTIRGHIRMHLGVAATHTQRKEHMHAACGM